MLCTIIDIRGDYAYVRYEDTGVVSEVAHRPAALRRRPG